MRGSGDTERVSNRKKGGYAIGQLTSEVKKVREAVEAKDTD